MLADTECRWTSRPASNREMPSKWYEFNDDFIKLKDLGRGFYKNEFLSNVVFRYMLPIGINREKEILLGEIKKLPESRRVVKLYKVAHGHDNYLGEWIIVEANAEKEPYVLLHRLREQTEQSVPTLTARSLSEAKHKAVLEELFPDCNVIWEPECTSGLRTNVVENGVVNTWASDFYTIDYIVSCLTKGLLLSFESKCCVEDFDKVAYKKCRILRDRGHRRIFAILGHGPELRVIDFGANNAEEREYSRPEFEIVAQQLVSR